ncbi:DNA topoisomerase 3-alpha isoform X1 [Beta vulgaris subsp. vulgaris]|uniref:DNA topoisomerase 3-alpha isoform X1 n=1 Tax=Beta vulgaris subsp. vulgaris TaxID=3555 RepID=UPI002036CD66|nr:DNA topoisomerase 3-alpha isoform X1 [Beta vulgaris subsp. vulgaris]
MARNRPIRALNVAEKPSVAKAVSGILSSNQARVREGRSRYNKIFEFDYTIRGQPIHMLFTSVTGHLMELEFDDRYRKWHSCDPVELYQAPVRKGVPQDKVDIKRTLQQEIRSCQWLILWLDCDREGENIAFEVIEVCAEVNPNLNMWRARFSALIDREIHEAVQNLDRPNQSFADAVDARQEIDLRIGASFTRFQTMLLKDAFNFNFATDDRSLVLSYGPCQFPTLGFVVERYWEIQAHEPEEFWTINCSHNSEEGMANFSWMRGHIFDYTCAVSIYEMCVEEPIATVTMVRQQEKLKYPPYPLSTIELEKRASRYFRMSSEQTMKVAEELYQSGFISYPRTETDSFSARTDLHAIVQEQQAHPVWGSYAQRLLDPEAALWKNPGSGGHDDKAHPPIHPTKFSAGESRWSQDHHKVYELVVRHFLACVSQPAVSAETTVEIDIAGELFSASGRVILSKNYLDIYRYESWGGSVIPTYMFGQQFTPTTLTLDSGVTRPPPLLSEADLLGCMDKAGIGTDATMHDHIKKLLDRFYAVKDANTRFSPTNLGEALVMGYDDMGYELWKPYLRSKMEDDMKAVSLGIKRKIEILASCLQEMKACFLDTKQNKVKLFEAMEIFFDRTNRPGVEEQHAIGEVVRRCGLCRQADMVLKRKPDGKFMVGCLGFPQCRNVVWLPGSISEAVVTSNTCNSCSPGPIFMIQFKFRRLEIPPNYSVDHLGCVGGCDDTLKQLTEICGTGPRNLSGTSASVRGPTPTTSFGSNPASNVQRGVCFHCRQAGHNSNNCPSQVSISGRAGSRATNHTNGGSSVTCNSCGEPCALRTANTENNRGRKFYSCQSQECRFFVWEDMMNDGAQGQNTNARGSNATSGRQGGRGRGRRGGRSRGNDTTFVSATGEPVSGGRCFTCGDPSHFANSCPNRGM